MPEIKSVLSALCKVLKSVTDLNLETEHLRVAKFNKTDGNSVEILWNVLHKLCSTTCIENNSEYCKDVVLCVKMCFASCHYHSFTFYCLPHDMSSGSREILLAFGWLLADTNVLEAKLLDFVKIKLFTDLPKSPSKDSKTTNDHSNDLHLNKLNNDELCQHIIWLAGRIKQNLKSITNMAAERIRLISKVQSVTKDAFGLPYLTVEQITLMKQCNKNPEKEYDVQYVNTVLEEFFYYLEHQTIFWNWLETVLREDEENGDTFQGNEHDFDKFLAMLKIDVRREILKDPSDDYIVLFDHLKSKFLDCAYNNQTKMKESLVDIKSDIDELTNVYNNKVKEISKCLENLRS